MLKIVNGSYALSGRGEALPDLGGRQCPMCRGKMGAFGDQASGERIWECGNPDCQFGYPIFWYEDYWFLLKLVEDRRRFLQAIHTDKVPAEVLCRSTARLF